MQKMFYDKRVDIGDEAKEIYTSAARGIFPELERYFGKPMENISREYWQYREKQDKQRQEQVAQREDKNEIIEYYRGTKQFVYPLAYWEATKGKQNEFRKIYLFCRKFGIGKLLDFGGGVGGMSIFMSGFRIKCDYLDVAGHTSDFAKWRFKERKINVRCYFDWESLPNAAYDGVVAYDVLEHLFDVESAIKEIGRTLQKRGSLITRSAFVSEGGLHLPKNKKFGDMRLFDEIIKSYGFSFIGQLKPNYFSRFLHKAGLKDILTGIRIKNRLKYGGNFIVYRKEK